MSVARRLRATVQPGGKIVIAMPDLPTGQAVVVTVQPTDGRARRSVLDVLAASSGGVAFKTAEEVDQYIRGERESWGH